MCPELKNATPDGANAAVTAVQSNQGPASAGAGFAGRSLSAPDRIQRTRLVLLVDDEELVRSSNRRVLSRGVNEKLDFVDADGYGSALQAHKENEFDLVLTDLRMPTGTEGLELLREIRKIKPHAVVIVMSGDATGEDIAKIMAAGAFRFLAKPVDMDILRQNANAALEEVARLEAQQSKTE